MVREGSCGVAHWNGEPFKSKKELKEYAASGGSFKIRVLSIFNERMVYANSEDLPSEDGVFYCAGPVAESDRRWYAEITMKNGEVRIK